MRQAHTPARTPFALVLLAAAIGQAYAQTPPAPADGSDGQVVTITTGTRSAKAVDKIPGAVTLVSKQEVEHTLALTEDATAVLARTVPGYSESSQAMSNTGENLRGRIALRLFDGIPQGSPLREGTRNGSFADMGLIGRIEVINGPSASEGIGAAGGIINYISKVPTKPGDEFTLVSRYTTQFHDDSGGWKLGANFARKLDAYDLLIGISRIDRGMTYDANGRRIGLNTSGSTVDSKADSVFLKAGTNFGNANEQRLQVSANSFKMTGNGNYRLVDGDRETGTTNTAERPGLFGALAEINDFKQGNLSYTHANLWGGFLTLDLYAADQAMRYPAEDGADRQDPLIAPLGTLIDQSEVRSKKKGLRTSYARQDAFAVKGLELRGGVDLTRDQADQRLALTDRLWVPPMIYTSTAPWFQASYDLGPVTISGGLRREDGELKVDSYTTVYFRKRAQVEGGTLSYTSNLPNLGVILRLPEGWSMFGSTSKGFTLPNLGIPLRNVSVPGQSVKGILDLQGHRREERRDRRQLARPHGFVQRVDLPLVLAVRPVAVDRPGDQRLRAQPRAGRHQGHRAVGRTEDRQDAEGQRAVLAHPRQDAVRRQRAAGQGPRRARRQPGQARSLRHLDPEPADLGDAGRHAADVARPERRQERRGAHQGLHAVRLRRQLRDGPPGQGHAGRGEPAEQAVHPELVAGGGLPQLHRRPRPRLFDLARDQVLSAAACGSPAQGGGGRAGASA
jgi:iron complex outermembrane receptor protein